MVIGVDAGALSITDDRLKVGVYRVTKQALIALSNLDKENHYRLYTFGAIEEGITRWFDGRADVVQLPRRGWQRVWLPIELKKHPVYAFLGFTQVLPSVRTLYDMGFIYDLGFLYHPEAYGMAAKTLKLQTNDLVRRASHIITISHATKSDLTREYGLPTGKITVAYPGVDAHFSPKGAKHASPNQYFLFVGSLNKAKDIPTLVRSFAMFLKQMKKDYDLYLIGGDYWPDPAIEETVRTFHLENRVKKIGFVPDGDLPKYYRGTLAFVTTALQEGFCLPAAEAMACGTPVVALDRGALKEIVGVGGIIVREAGRVKSKTSKMSETLAEAMGKMTDLSIREEFAKKAIIQARKFRWEEFGRKIIDRVRPCRQATRSHPEDAFLRCHEH